MPKKLASENWAKRKKLSNGPGFCQTNLRKKRSTLEDWGKLSVIPWGGPTDLYVVRR